jgi:hypothetical protein
MKRIVFLGFLFLAFTTLSSLDTKQKRLQRRNEWDRPNFASMSNTPQWAKTYKCSYAKGGYSWEPDGVFYAIQETTDGGYILTTGLHGEDNLGLDADTWVLKLDLYGEIEWQRVFGGDLCERWPSIQQARDGGYIVLSNISSPYGSDLEVMDTPWVFKLTADGDIEWQKTFRAHSYCYSLKATDDGGCVVTGYSYLFEGWILKLDSLGAIEWQRTVGDGFHGVCTTEDGGYFVSSNMNGDVWAAKLNSLGEIEWQRTYGGSGWDGCTRGIQQTSDGGYILTCTTNSFGAGGYDLWILKLDSVGGITWQRTYGGSEGDEQARSIQQTNDGGYIVAGDTFSFGARDSDIWILKLTLSGDIEWQRTYGGSGEDWTDCSIQQTSDGGYILGGWSESLAGNLLILKLSPDGNINPSCFIGGSSDAQVSDTYVTPQGVNTISQSTNAISQNTSVVPQHIDATPTVHCWNLNQPPINVTLKREKNSSLFRSEAFHTISWESNPYNQQFSIIEYRIYRKMAAESGMNYRMIGTVSSTTFEFVDRNLDIGKGFDYVVTSVSSDGFESPKSLRVRNSFS